MGAGWADDAMGVCFRRPRPVLLSMDAGRADRVAASRGKARVSWHLGTIPLTLQHALAQVRRQIVTASQLGNFRLLLDYS